MAKKHLSPVYEQIIQERLRKCQVEVQKSRAVLDDAKKLIEQTQKLVDKSRILRRG